MNITGRTAGWRRDAQTGERKYEERRRENGRVWVARLETRNPLQARLLERMALEELTFKQVAQRAGVHWQTLTSWFKLSDHCLTRRSIGQLGAFLEIPLEQAIRESGGTTAEERLVGNAERARAGLTEQSFRKAARTKGRWSHTAAARSKIRAAKAGYSPQNLSRILAARRTQDGRILQCLLAHLRWHPDATSAEIRSQTAVVAERFGVQPELVTDLWRPTLHRLGKAPSGGRPHLDDRGKLIAKLVASQPPGRLPRGFWRQVEAAVAALEGPSSPPADDLRIWWWRARWRYENPLQNPSTRRH